jgi:hypothetical protein
VSIDFYSSLIEDKKNDLNLEFGGKDEVEGNKHVMLSFKELNVTNKAHLLRLRKF